VRKIVFYKTAEGNNPVRTFLNTLSDKQAKKIAWVLRLVRDLNFVPEEYFKKLVNTDGIWEVRIQSGNNIFRILCFFEKGNLIVLTNGFVKKNTKNSKKGN